MVLARTLKSNATYVTGNWTGLEQDPVVESSHHWWAIPATDDVLGYRLVVFALTARRGSTAAPMETTLVGMATEVSTIRAIT